MIDWNAPVSVWWAIVTALFIPLNTIVGFWWGFRRAERRARARRAVSTVPDPFDEDHDEQHDPAEFARVVDELRVEYARRRYADSTWSAPEQTTRHGRDRHVP